jgi:hypothetical protein
MCVYNVRRIMAIALFERFEAMVERLPTKAVVSAIELERQMLEDDLARKRTMPMDEVGSIIAFCNFIENPADAARTPHPVPLHHFGFYRATVKRLVEAGELSYETGALFDAAFFASGFKSLKAA